MESRKKEMQHQMEKATAFAVQAREHSYQQGRSDTLVYLHKVLLTLAGEFLDDRYYEAYLRFVDEREQAAAEGRNPDEVEFILRVTLLRTRPPILWKPRPVRPRRKVVVTTESPTCNPPAPFIHACFCFLFRTWL